MNNVFLPAEILLPGEEVNMEKWAVLACDQFTSQPEYWQKVEDICRGEASTFNIILPEVYLEDENVEDKIKQIQENMKEYKANVLTRRIMGYVYVERETSGGIRQGIVGCVDLEDYDYEKGSNPIIRPSENTVVERIPPRLAVRRGACLESPHILMLIDDGGYSLFDMLQKEKSKMEKLYSFPLMLDGGKIEGWAINTQDMIDLVKDELNELDNAGQFSVKYGADSNKAFVMAVGDGNHSLATAKAYWEEVKAAIEEEDREYNPARYCLVELENIQSPAIEIEPIHRLFFHVKKEDVEKAFRAFCEKNGGREGEGQSFVLMGGPGEDVKLSFANMKWPLAVASLEAFLAEYTIKNPDLKVDYIHGEESLRQLAGENNTAILLPPFEKGDLFKGLALGGVLPKKTFSMGHAEEKRYYLECRKID